MRSPFPGMDPYLESPTHWSDFHATFIPELRDAINRLLPDEYIARIGEYLLTVASTEESDDESKFVPDIAVTRDQTMPVDYSAGSATALAMPTPVTLQNLEYVDQPHEVYIEILRLPEQKLITVLELLSPTNKYGNGRGDYMRKRAELLHKRVNLVELDLLRTGRRFEFTKPLPRAHYFAFISRSDHPRSTEAYPWTVRDRMPAIPIPLKSPDQDLIVDLAPPFAAAYKGGRYWKLIDYKQPPQPPFLGPDAEWAAELGKAGARP